MQAPNIYSPAVADMFARNCKLSPFVRSAFQIGAANLKAVSRVHYRGYVVPSSVNSTVINSMPNQYSAQTVPRESVEWQVIDSIFNHLNRDHHGLNVSGLSVNDRVEIANTLYEMPFIKYNLGNKYYFEQILRQRGFRDLIQKPQASQNTEVVQKASSTNEKYPVMSRRFNQYAEQAFNFLKSRESGILSRPEILKFALPTLHDVDMTKVDSVEGLVRKFPYEVIRGYVLKVRNDILPKRSQMLEPFENHLRERFELLNFLMRDYSIPRHKDKPITFSKEEIGQLGKALFRLGNKDFDLNSLEDYTKFKELYGPRLKAAFDFAASKN